MSLEGFGEEESVKSADPTATEALCCFSIDPPELMVSDWRLLLILRSGIELSAVASESVVEEADLRLWAMGEGTAFIRALWFPRG